MSLVLVAVTFWAWKAYVGVPIKVIIDQVTDI